MDSSERQIARCPGVMDEQERCVPLSLREVQMKNLQ